MRVQECWKTGELACEEFARLIGGRLTPFTLTEDEYILGIVSLPEEASAMFWLVYDELKKKGRNLSYNEASIGFFSAAARLKLLNVTPN